MGKLNAYKDYPIYEKHPEILKTATGMAVDEISLENITSGKITADDCRISPDTLKLQAEVQESFGNPQIAENFRRAAEMTVIPDTEILAMYNKLRPGMATKEELMKMAEDLRSKYGAVLNAKLIETAADIYEKREMLRDED